MYTTTPVYAIQTNHEHVEVRITSEWEENFLKHIFKLNIIIFKLNIYLSSQVE
jgi:hypothetical protein